MKFRNFNFLNHFIPPRIHTDYDYRLRHSVSSSPRFLCCLTALIKLLVAVQRQRVLYTETIEFASQPYDRHISMFRGYRILFSIINLI